MFDQQTRVEILHTGPVLAMREGVEEEADPHGPGGQTADYVKVNI